MASSPLTLRLEVLGDFGVLGPDCQIEVSPAAQKLLALIALHDGFAHRDRLAFTLWPDHAPDRARANIRSVVWRLPEVIRGQVVRPGKSIGLSQTWSVDLMDARRTALSAIAEVAVPPAGRHLLTKDVLPHWDDFWLTVQREQHRQLRLHALEALALTLLEHDRPLDAVDVAMEAVAAEPLRESAQSLLIRSHLSAGNRAAAICQFRQLKELLNRELSVAPSKTLRELVEDAGK
jgi:DNA-binding SARP family transcriptional activator